MILFKERFHRSEGNRRYGCAPGYALYEIIVEGGGGEDEVRITGRTPYHQPGVESIFVEYNN